MAAPGGQAPVEKSPRPIVDVWNQRRSMNLWEEYHLATSIHDALQTLASAPGSARVIAGGTDLLLDLQQGRHAPVHSLVDVTPIPELSCLEVRKSGIFIGAAVPLQRITASSIIFEHARALQEACGLIGGPQVRNTATLGGNVAHALPAADGTIALLALNARAEVADLKHTRIIELQELFLGPGRSALHPQNELLVGFYLPFAGDSDGSAFRRIMRPQGVAIAILNMGVWFRRVDDVIWDVRIAVGPGGPKPFRAKKTEDFLRGRKMDDTGITRAMDILISEASFRTSRHRATRDYRRHVAKVLLKDTLKTAWERSHQE